MKKVLFLFGVAGCVCAGGIERGSAEARAKQVSSKELNSVKYLTGICTKIDNDEIKEIADLGVEGASSEDRKMLFKAALEHLYNKKDTLTPTMSALKRILQKESRPTWVQEFIHFMNFQVTGFMVFACGALFVIGLLRQFPISVRVIN